MATSSDAACPRCDGPALHPGTCIDADGDVYPDYSALARAWEEQGRPALTAAQVIELQEAIQTAGADQESSAGGQF